jgi:2-polyprenyl-3-methyl-5-hydroxy-6-metoxy-1,4-benzoquinol methylase
MFTEESFWIGETLSTFPMHSGYKVLDIGSSNLAYRTKVQPHITENIITPLEIKGCKITYLDIKDDEGVDLVLDLTSPSLPDETFVNKYDLIICCNILEHVGDPIIFMGNLTRFSKGNGHILITVPYRYFKHDDPIDMMYRPSLYDLKELCGRFVRFTVKREVALKISEKKYYIFPRGRLLDYLPYRTHQHLWRYYFKPFRWEVSGMLLQIQFSL